ncbi:aminoglycoside phosphotransferase family protein [Candidatus Nanopelagicales bacterium]|nr:aminoglycoside phosphotransferase family protein [Candidatus Nanopelagicales bacterium]
MESHIKMASGRSQVGVDVDSNAYFTWEHDRECIHGLLDSIGARSMASYERLTGGRNSRTYLVHADDAYDVVVKVYPDLWEGSFDRRAAEADFLNYAASSGCKNVAQLLATDKSLNASAMSRIDGVSFKTTDAVGLPELAQMVEFLRTLNNYSSSSGDLRPAAESCFSIEEHLTLVNKRVEQLVDAAESIGCPLELRSFVRRSLEPAWWATLDRTLAMADRRGLDRSQIIDVQRRRVSPSDFGLHNALKNSRGLIHFLDFEYAGIDDPAKLICDSLNQPRVPIPGSLRARSVATFAEALRMDESDLERVSLLKAPYMVKWACIMLNVVVQSESRSALAGAGIEIGILMGNQLTLATRQIERVRQVMERSPQ